MSKQVTVIELLRKKLPPDYVVAIIENVKEKNMLDEEAEDIFYELSTLFNWDESREGSKFWANVFSAIKENSQLPKMPVRVDWMPNTYLSTEVGDFIININGSENDAMLSFDFKGKSRSKEELILKQKYLAFCN